MVRSAGCHLVWTTLKDYSSSLNVCNKRPCKLVEASAPQPFGLNARPRDERRQRNVSQVFKGTNLVCGSMLYTMLLWEMVDHTRQNIVAAVAVKLSDYVERMYSPFMCGACTEGLTFREQHALRQLRDGVACHRLFVVQRF